MKFYGPPGSHGEIFEESLMAIFGNSDATDEDLITVIFRKKIKIKLIHNEQALTYQTSNLSDNTARTPIHSLTCQLGRQFALKIPTLVVSTSTKESFMLW